MPQNPPLHPKQHNRMTPPRPTITTSLPEGQALQEDLVSILDDQYSRRSYDQIDDMVTNWQQDNVTLQQTTTTTTTKEVVIPKRTSEGP